MNFSNYLFNASMVGKLISANKPLSALQRETLNAYRERMAGKGRPLTEKQKIDLYSLEVKNAEAGKVYLSETAKTELNDIVFYEENGRRKALQSKYLDKGNIKEKDSRDLISSISGIFLTKDDEKKANDWVKGYRDIKSDKVIIDIKTSFNYKSFNNHLKDNPNEVYLCQLDCYMDLWGIKDSILCHTLVDTPNRLINDEIRRLDWQKDILNFEGNVREECIDEIKGIVEDHIYTRKGLEGFCFESESIKVEWFDDFVEIPEHKRVHMIPHSFQKERIQQRNEAIILAREYMNENKIINPKTIKWELQTN